MKELIEKFNNIDSKEVFSLLDISGGDPALFSATGSLLLNLFKQRLIVPIFGNDVLDSEQLFIKL